MTIMKTTIVAGSAILATLALSTTASAGEWTGQPFSLSQPENEQLYTATSDTTAVTFTCVKTKLRVAISTENNEAEKITTRFNDSRGKKRKAVDLKINGEAVPSKKWVYANKSEIYVTPDRTTSAKIYNAALMQKPVTIQSKYMDEVEFVFPPLNKDFTDFGAACGLGTLRKS